jgi:hypothetical protein
VFINNQIVHQTRTKSHQVQETENVQLYRCLLIIEEDVVYFYSHTQVFGADALNGPEHKLVYPIVPLT